MDKKLKSYVARTLLRAADALEAHENAVTASPKAGRASMSRIDQFRKIVTEKQWAKIDGTPIDLFSANAVVQIYDKLSDANKKKFEAMKAPKMVDVALKVMYK